MLCAMSDQVSNEESEEKSEPPSGEGLEETASVAALVLGAGRGERLGHSLPKAFVPVAGQTLIERSIRSLSGSRSIGRIQPVLDPGEFDRFKELELQDVPQLISPVGGGAERQDSMREGLRSLPNEIRWVAVHDAARGLVSSKDVARVVARARQTGAAILAERVRDTIKRVVDGRVVETPPREECWAAQTPQVMRRDWLEESMEKASASDRLGTDDAQLLEWAGFPVAIVEAQDPNPKITRPEDLALAEAITKKEASAFAPVMVGNSEGEDAR
jgi:2-C-methyl-D-erythritol 4-phosphate cytidylyltransferase